MTTPVPGRARFPEARFGLAATLLGVPTAVALLDPAIAVVLFTAELAVVVVAFLTALFAPEAVSERAFRLLRWMTGNPEPAHPQTSPQRTPR